MSCKGFHRHSRIWFWNSEQFRYTFAGALIVLIMQVHEPSHDNKTLRFVTLYLVLSNQLSPVDRSSRVTWHTTRITHIK